MNHDSDRRRVLVAAGADKQLILRELFQRHALDSWVTIEADCFSKARFVLQHEPCDVLLVNDDLYEREGGQGLSWLAWQREVPIVLLVGPAAETYARAYQLGVSICLPRDLVLAHPPMLAGALDQAVSMGEMRFGYQRMKEQLAQSRRHNDCLVNLLWRSTPRSNDGTWFPQRYMLERLCEELARTERHGVPLTMVLGEVEPENDVVTPGMPDWAARVIIQSKRRCDVAGQYGTQGFLLLLVHTNQERAVSCCRRLQSILEEPPQTLQAPHRLQSYFGVAGVGPGRNTPQSLLRHAEEKLEAARLSVKERIAAD